MVDTMSLTMEDLGSVKKKMPYFMQREDRDADMYEEVSLLQYFPQDNRTHGLQLAHIARA